ncbi:MAG: DUF4338 domain-containing protein, partial [Anaerolineae bacterium]|nr:DUF4338 domain-containing protein [Anaerolineae bacterium]
MDTLELRELVLERLKAVGFAITENGALHPPLADKEYLRQIHRPASQLEIAARQGWLRRHLPEYLTFFANGDEIVPERVDPALIEVTTGQQHDLFRMARLLWSIPFSKGYGRRLRFLIVDRANGRLMGLLALQSPPLCFPARDRLFRYPPAVSYTHLTLP